MKKLLILALLTTTAIGVFAEKAAPTPERHAPHPHRQKRNNFRKGHGMWMAFAELSPEERQAMLKLQREDPEKFRTEMHKLGEEFFKAEKLRRLELAALVEKYKTAGEKEKPQLLEKIKTMVQENFKRRLRQSRMQLDELQKRAEKLEKELDRREKAEEKIVDTVVNNIISGKRPNYGKRPHRRFATPPQK